MRAHWANTILAAASLTASLAGAELVVRKFAPVSDTSGRFLMFSSPHFRVDDADAVRYLPNEDVRSVSVYDGSIEYDVRYHTNNLGFIDDRDYGDSTTEAAVAERYAIVGNSFAAGIHGGKPWVPTLRTDLTAAIGPTRVYNLGVEGTGIQHFADLLASFARHRSLTHIVIVAISNDFQRPRWRPVTSASEIHFCEPVEMPRCQGGPPTATVIGYDDTEAQILEHTRRVARQTIARLPPPTFVEHLRELARHSELLRRVSRLAKARSATRRKLVDSSLAALARTRARFPGVPISFIHVPEKEEVQMKAYLFDPSRRLETLGIGYYPALGLCQWSPAMFLPRDNHPNAAGYQHVEQCVLKILLDQRKARTAITHVRR
jgi:hypothetical protein